MSESMLSFDRDGVLDLISGVLVFSTQSPVPAALTMLLGTFLGARGLSAVVDRVDLPDLTFVIDGGADLAAGAVLLAGTVSLPIISGYSAAYAGILLLKGGWTYWQEM
ncbi:MAG: hypothetical protein ABEJ98_05730 [Candidatus Nanohaloarchaea archaeon]